MEIKQSNSSLEKEAKEMLETLRQSLPYGLSETELLSKLSDLNKALTQVIKLSGIKDSTTGSEAKIYFSAGVQNTYRGKDSFGHYDKWVEATNKVWEIEGKMLLVANTGEFIEDDEGNPIPPAQPNRKPGYFKTMF